MALRSAGGTLDHRRRLSDAYFSTHFSRIRTPDLDAIRRDFPFFRRHFLPRLPRDPGAAILDIGCGFGAMLYALRQHGFRDVVGVDISPEQVELASHLGIEGVHQADVFAYLKAKPQGYDAILAVDVLEHLKKDELVDLIDALFASLRPGGRFIAQTINAESPFFGRLRYGDFTHELAFTSRSITQVLRVGGFDAVATYPVEPAVHGAKSAARWLIWLGARSLLALYLSAETGATRGHIMSQNLIAVATKPE